MESWPYPSPSETGWGRDQFVRIYLVMKVFIEVIWSYCKFIYIFVYNFTVFRNVIILFIPVFWNSSFILFALLNVFHLWARSVPQWQCVSRCIWSDMHSTLIVTFLRVSKSVLSLYDLSGVWSLEANIKQHSPFKRNYDIYIYIYIYI